MRFIPFNVLLTADGGLIGELRVVQYVSKEKLSFTTDSIHKASKRYKL